MTMKEFCIALKRNSFYTNADIVDIISGAEIDWNNPVQVQQLYSELVH
jgi:hypothetical protein